MSSHDQLSEKLTIQELQIKALQDLLTEVDIRQRVTETTLIMALSILAAANSSSVDVMKTELQIFADSASELELRTPVDVLRHAHYKKFYQRMIDMVANLPSTAATKTPVLTVIDGGISE